MNLYKVTLVTETSACSCDYYRYYVATTFEQALGMAEHDRGADKIHAVSLHASGVRVWGHEL